MRPRSLPLLAAVLLPALVLLPACDVVEPDPPTAILSITVNPTPVVIRLACVQSVPPPDVCLASLSPTITISETGGVGGRIDAIELSVRNTSSNTELARIALDSAYLRAQAGTDRLEARGQISVRPVVEDYPIRREVAPLVGFIVTVRMTDDNNHAVTQTLQIGGST